MAYPDSSSKTNFRIRFKSIYSVARAVEANDVKPSLPTSPQLKHTSTGKTWFTKIQHFYTGSLSTPKIAQSFCAQ